MSRDTTATEETIIEAVEMEDTSQEADTKTILEEEVSEETSEEETVVALEVAVEALEEDVEEEGDKTMMSLTAIHSMRKRLVKQLLLLVSNRAAPGNLTSSQLRHKLDTIRTRPSLTTHTNEQFPKIQLLIRY